MSDPRKAHTKYTKQITQNYTKMTQLKKLQNICYNIYNINMQIIQYMNGPAEGGFTAGTKSLSRPCLWWLVATDQTEGSLPEW